MGRFAIEMLVLGVVVLVGLVCGAALIGGGASYINGIVNFREEETIPPPPTLDPDQTMLAPPTALATPTAAEPEATAIQLTPRPTFTPRSGTLPTRGPASAATVGPIAATATIVNTGPLRFSYTINWRIDPNDSSKSIATVSFSPLGGGGGYQYFRDELPVAGPIFEYFWTTCAANPGSLRVSSADGQSVKIDYFERSPCP